MSIDRLVKSPKMTFYEVVSTKIEEEREIMKCRHTGELMKS
jgi:hypothetical protein